MKVLLSPAKSLNFDTDLPTQKSTIPQFAEETSKLIEVLQTKSKSDLAQLMSISDNLAALNYDRFQDFDSKADTLKSRPAIYTFNGDVYNGFDAFSISADHIDFMQDTVRVLSGLYGILKPLDQMQAYRLEMGTSLKVDQSKNLYEFWQAKITHQLKEELANDEIIVNLASQEYAKSVDFNAIDQTIIHPQFKDFKNGKLKTIPFYAKKARGMMARFIVDHQVSDKEQLKDFSYADYAFSEEHTEKKEKPVFIR